MHKLTLKASVMHNIIVNTKLEFFMSCCDAGKTDYGPEPYVADVGVLASENQNFREAVWTGKYLQMTLMSIPAGGEIGLEIHQDTDQLIRIEQGCAVVNMGACKDKPDFQRSVCRGDSVFVPAGTWHNVINTGRNLLKVSSVYAPPHHPRGIVQRTAQAGPYNM
jgi:mannose-6-phosphate isomerase-like protein (cupin superfamily)